MHSAVLFAANRAGVFPLLERPSTAAEVADALRWDHRGTQRLLDGLVAAGLAGKDHAHYRNTPMASACLVAGRAAYLGDFIRHTERTFSNWQHLETCVRTGKGIKRGQHKAVTEELRDFVCGLENVAAMNAPEVIKAVDLSGCCRLLDLAGGSGAYALAALRAYPGLHATIFDVPAVLAFARRRVAEAGLESRCECIPGDYLADDLGQGYDAILMSNVVHGLGPRENRLLVRRCFEALEPGGRLLVKDFLTDDARTGPPFSLIFSLHMLVHTEAGQTYTVRDVATWTQEAGFEKGRMYAPGRKARLWVAAKPR